MLGDRVQNLARGGARGQSLGVGREDRKALVPSVGKLPVLDAIKLVRQVGMFRLVATDRIEPGVAQLLAALADPFAEVVVYAVRNIKFLVLGPAVCSLRELDLLFAERFAVGGTRVLLMRCPIADMAIDDDQGWPVSCMEERGEGSLEHGRDRWRR